MNPDQTFLQTAGGSYMVSIPQSSIPFYFPQKAKPFNSDGKKTDSKNTADKPMCAPAKLKKRAADELIEPVKAAKIAHRTALAPLFRVPQVNMIVGFDSFLSIFVTLSVNNLLGKCW